ncbi:MAG: DUF979 domain-containing protein [Spirochaetales bacterium]|nr:DUF979 domain-containing protein [Spirochaetales bacterium]
MKGIILEIIYILVGLISLCTAFQALRDPEHPAPKGTAAFWGLLGLIFIAGKYMPPAVVGGIILCMGVLTATKRVRFGSQSNAEEEQREKRAEKFGSKLFIPALTIGVVAFIFGSFIKPLGGLVGLGAGALLATLIGLFMTKTEAKYVPYDGSRLLQQVGSASVLPQLLAALGSLFAAAGVGEVISGGMGAVIPENSRFWAVLFYCLGMMVFTVIMGNGFAAFAVITAGIGMPFVFSQGANPAIAGILALTAGYCGTLMTPMAANFNMVPAAVLETKSKYRVIMAQAPFALALWFIHVILMYTLAF